jgi:hypothetical protein
MIDNLQYRLRVAGPYQLLKDARDKLFSSRQDRIPIRHVGDATGKRRVLFVHQGAWAIYNVGIEWFSAIPGVTCTMVDVEDFIAKPELQHEHDLVVFGYTQIFRACLRVVRTRPSIVCVHDPRELFDEVPDWRSHRANPGDIELFKEADLVVCTSHEMRDCLAEEGVVAICVPTTSLLPAIPSPLLETRGRLRVTTVGRIYRRKRFELFREVATMSRTKGLPIDFYAKYDRRPLPELKYISYLDRSQIYMVTSFQEGGPLPAMDAMQRGLVVLSTPVGQMPEIVVDASSGFICCTASEFIERLSMLSNDPAMLSRMRRESLNRINEVRSGRTIADAVEKMLTAIPIPAVPHGPADAGEL